MTSLLVELKKLHDPVRALKDAAYHKSKREHLGIPTPSLTVIAKSSCKGLKDEEIFLFAKELWETEVFDAMICATKMVTLPRISASPALWNTLLEFLQKVDGWALEDQLSHAAWKCILKDLSLLDQLEEWTKHQSFWIRRAALVYTLPFAKKGKDPERMLGWASIYASDPEWFIQKAIGWWLRVLGAHNKERVLSFLDAHHHLLKGVAKREATRKL